MNLKVKIRNKKWWGVLLVAVMIVTSACGNGSSDNRQAANNETGTGNREQTETIELVYQAHITPNLTAEYYDEMIRLFESEHPGVKVTRIQAPASEGSNDNYLKTLLASGDFPDVASNFNALALVQSEALLEIPIDDDVKQIKNYEMLLHDGKLYDLSANIQPHSLIFYNKSLFAQAGISQTPRTWDELDEVVERLQAEGITPMLTSGEWITGWAFSAMSAPEVFLGQPDWYAKRYENQVSFTDPDWLEAAERWHSMAMNGYFNEGALSIGFADLEQVFLSGQGAMMPMGVWFTATADANQPDFEVGVFPVPTKDGTLSMVGGQNQAGNHAVSKLTAHPEEAVNFAKFMVLNHEAHSRFLEADGLFSNLQETVEYNFTPLQREVAEILEQVEQYTGHASSAAGKAPVAGISNQYRVVAQNLMFSGADIEAEMRSLDEYWDSHE